MKNWEDSYELELWKKRSIFEGIFSNQHEDGLGSGNGGLGWMMEKIDAEKHLEELDAVLDDWVKEEEILAELENVFKNSSSSSSSSSWWTTATSLDAWQESDINARSLLEAHYYREGQNLRSGG